MNEEPENNQATRSLRVVKPYATSYPTPIVVKQGECLIVGDKVSEFPGWLWCTDRQGRSGWVPKRYVQRSGNDTTMLNDYNATELTVETGEILTLCEEESGWLLCERSDGTVGWIPKDHVATLT